jgi:hypothetical protein
MNRSNTNRIRFYQLLADEQLDQITPEEQEELDAMRHTLQLPEPNTLGELIVMLDSMDQESGMPDQLPEHLQQSISRIGQALVSMRPKDILEEEPPASIPIDTPIESPAPSRPRKLGLWIGGSIAASLGVGLVAGFALMGMNSRAHQRELESKIATLLEQNEQAEQRLASIAEELDSALGAIAYYETPQDPTELLARRTELLRMEGTFTIAWQPFDLEGSPAAITDVSGDVVWNDALARGYLRLTGLPVNDPSREQYQVWVIDERGLEQRVSGGVFNASQDGEVVVPIDPAIDIGRVALFAITVEDPGGTWVSDLDRRVVVAPRTEG